MHKNAFLYIIEYIVSVEIILIQLRKTPVVHFVPSYTTTALFISAKLALITIKHAIEYI